MIDWVGAFERSYTMNMYEIRTLTGLSQRAFADRYHIPYRNIENWEQGSRTPSAWILELLEFRVLSDYPETEKEQEE